MHSAASRAALSAVLLVEMRAGSSVLRMVAKMVATMVDLKERQKAALMALQKVALTAVKSAPKKAAYLVVHLVACLVDHLVDLTALKWAARSVAY